MIGNIIAYTLVVIFAVFGFVGVIGVFFDKSPDKADGFWGGVFFIVVSLLFAWVWGI